MTSSAPRSTSIAVRSRTSAGHAATTAGAPIKPGFPSSGRTIGVRSSSTSLRAPNVNLVRALTGLGKRDFSEWLAARTGRAPFADDVVTAVLDPCYQVRKRLSSRFDKATASGGTAPSESRAVAATERWFAHHDGRLVTILGHVSGRSLAAAGFIDQDGAVLAHERGGGQAGGEVIKRMNRVDAHSGFSIKIVLADLARLRADQLLRFALLLR
jgi:hypothetical protein